jgi:hypothetical protein
MPNTIILQIGLIILLIAPGYVSCSVKEMWLSSKEKSQLERLLNSLINSILIWSIFWVFVRRTPRYYLMEGALPDLIGLPGMFLIFCTLIVSWLMVKIEKKLSIEKKQNIPLFDNIFKNTNKSIASIEIRTKDGYTYYGQNIKNRQIITGTNSYSGDISFVCEFVMNKEGEKTKYTDDELEREGFILRTYIPKENIKLIRYEQEI